MNDNAFSTFAQLVENAKAFPDRAAIIDPTRRINHADMPDLVLSRAAALLSAGLQTGLMTAVTIPDEVEHLLNSLALLALATPNISIGSFEKSEVRSRMAATLGVIQTVTVDPDGTGDVQILPAPDAPAQTAPADTTGLRQRLIETTTARDDNILYRSTSGTTGTPKTFGLPMHLLLYMMGKVADDPAKRCILRTSSVEYDSSRLHQIGIILAGCTAAILDQLTAAQLAPFCFRAGVTEIHTGTYRLASLLAAPPDPAHKLPEGLRILAGGSRVSGDIRRAVRERLTPHLWVNYATSEVGVISTAPPEEHEIWPEGVGHPDSGVEVVLRDAAGAEVPAGEPGEAWVFKTGINRWVRTGDILSWPKDGPLIFHARADDMMILNGINVFPGPIEDALNAHPAVAESVAFSIPSRLHGQIPVAAVVLKPHCTATEAELVGHVRGQLGVRGPRQVRIVEEIPRTALGKPKPAALGFKEPTPD